MYKFGFDPKQLDRTGHQLLSDYNECIDQNSWKLAIGMILASTPLSFYFKKFGITFVTLALSPVADLYYAERCCQHEAMVYYMHVKRIRRKLRKIERMATQAAQEEAAAAQVPLNNSFTDVP